MRTWTSLLILLFSATTLTCQTYTYHGCITDEAGEPLISATVLIKGTKTGAITDVEGCFTLQHKDSTALLVVSYTGYNSAEISATAGREVHQQLEASLVLEEVSVVGHARAERRARESAKLSRRADAAGAPAPLMRTATISTEGLTARSFAGEDAASSGPGRGAGQLTAGEVNDFTKWDLWGDVSKEDLAQYRRDWPLFADHRYTVQLSSEAGAALADVPVELRDRSGKALWRSRTDNTGKAELWAGFFDQQAQLGGGLTLVALHGGREYPLPNGKAFNSGLNFLRLPVRCAEERAVDIAFVVDATGSMSDEISYLQAELLDVIKRIQDTLPGSDLRLGSVFYRDHGDDYVTRFEQLSSDFKKTIDFIKKQSADGGGDTPEAVEEALTVALEQLQWREKAAARLLFLVLDAPPHQEKAVIERMQRLTAKAAALGVRIIPVTCSGIDKSTEYLMRSLALATNGTYTFLTDHSGIGNAHIEPSTDEYKVEKLNDLLVRLAVQFGRPAECELPIAATNIPHDQTTVTVTSIRDMQWQFWPNPSRGRLTLRLDGKNDKGTLFLADANGKLLERRELATTELDLDLSRYPAGTYFLRLEMKGGETSSGKLLLVRS